jgi:sirohydrochlorin cobaltochelatase
MKSIIVLAMHGAPPNDFPRDEIAELFGLHGRLDHAPEAQRAALEQRYVELDAKVRDWPRTPENDRFWAASYQMARYLGQATDLEVIVGFNEFCAPTLDEALDQAIAQGAEQVTVVTPMMTRGGEHSEVDIPAAIWRAEGRHPDVSFRYIWPFAIEEIAQFLAAQIAKFAP